MAPPHKKIRDEMISKIADERARLVVGSQFSAIPMLEAEYYDYISENPFYAGVFARWVLDQSPLPPTPTEEEFYRMRGDILGIQGIADPKTIRLNESFLLFFLDICSPFIEPLVAKGMEYYALSKSEKELVTAVKEAAFSALLLCDFEHVQKENYPLFVTAFLDAFKICFYGQIGAPTISVPTDDAELVRILEEEWLRLQSYSDSFYGFEVVPIISIEMMLRYLRLPFFNQEYRKLSATKAYRQVLNYIVACATFKPVPDSRVKAYFRQELCSLYLPLAEKLIKREAKKNNFFSNEDLRSIVLNEIEKAAGEFDYFYATKKNLINKKISPFDVMLFPLTDRYAAKLGHISDSDEFPFTSYLEKQLEIRMKFYFAEDPSSRDLSLDEEFRGEDGEKWTRLDTLSAESSELADYTEHIPDYDAKDKDGKLIGWKMNTFIGITGMSKDTLRRWDREGLLVPKRYPIYSSIYKKQVEYRAYVREDIPRAKEVEAIMAKKMRHQK